LVKFLLDTNREPEAGGLYTLKEVHYALGSGNPVLTELRPKLFTVGAVSRMMGTPSS